MPLTTEQRKQLDSDWIEGRKRLHLVSHAEIENAIADALETLVGGQYRVEITGWTEEKPNYLFGDSIRMTAVVKSEHRRDPFSEKQEQATNTGFQS
jgi:hypothetical protein